ncbi:MAG: hypothetical protein KG003_02095 [Bacteroidetes bacterium]|nr:hypothetical protein [Bacteroidota bacterium]
MGSYTKQNRNYTIVFVIAFIIICSSNCSKPKSNIVITGTYGKNKIQSLRLYSGNPDTSRYFDAYAFYRDGRIKGWQQFSINSGLGIAVKYDSLGFMQFVGTVDEDLVRNGLAMFYYPRCNIVHSVEFVQDDMGDSVSYEFYRNKLIKRLSYVAKNVEYILASVDSISHQIQYVETNKYLLKKEWLNFNYDSVTRIENRLHIYKNSVRSIGDIELNISLDNSANH